MRECRGDDDSDNVGGWSALLPAVKCVRRPVNEYSLRLTSRLILWPCRPRRRRYNLFPPLITAHRLN